MKVGTWLPAAVAYSRPALFTVPCCVPLANDTVDGVAMWG